MSNIEDKLNEAYPDTTSPNEMRLEFMGINGLGTIPMSDSSSRGVMFGSQLSQRIVTRKADRKLIITGMEREFAKSSSKIKMPHDGHILAIVSKFRQESLIKEDADVSPAVYIIYQRDDNSHIDYFVVKDFGSYDQLFGWKYHQVENNMAKLRYGQYIAKDTVFAEPPSTRNGYFDFGFNVNVLLDSRPEVAEDGFLASHELMEELNFDVEEKRVIEFGTKKYPLRIHDGKIFPGIGEIVKEDGLLMALRDIDMDTLPVDMSASGLEYVDYYSDELVFARAGHVGVVTDIKVERNAGIQFLPEQLCEQAQKYYEANLSFHKEILNTYYRLRAEHKRKYGQLADLPTTPACHELFVEAIAITRQENEDKGQVHPIYRKNRIDAWRVEITVRYNIKPGKDFKFADTHGGKGVVVKLLPRANMPRDKDGNIADLVICGSSRFARMIPGSLYELFLGGVQRDIVKHHIKPLIGWTQGVTEDAFMATVSDIRIGQAYSIYLEYLFLVSKTHFNKRKDMSLSKQKEIIFDICTSGSIPIFLPIGDPIDLSKTCELIQERFKPTMGYAEYTDIETGHKIVLKDPDEPGALPSVQIGVLYMIMLDKFGEEWMATSTSNMHHFGMAAPINKQMKHTLPYRSTAPRFGESEHRLFVANCGPYVTAELQARANSISTQKAIVKNILESDTPMKIAELVNRDVVDYGDVKPLQTVRHMYNCMGINMEWTHKND